MIENLDTQNEQSDSAEQKFIAHMHKSDGSEQLLYGHLTGTAEIAKNLATKIGLLVDILFICVASHHSGMVNIVDKKGHRYLQNRKHKEENKFHYQESLTNGIGNNLFSHLDKKVKSATLKEFNNTIADLLYDKSAIAKQVICVVVTLRAVLGKVCAGLTQA